MISQPFEIWPRFSNFRRSIVKIQQRIENLKQICGAPMTGLRSVLILFGSRNSEIVWGKAPWKTIELIRVYYPPVENLPLLKVYQRLDPRLFKFETFIQTSRSYPSRNFRRGEKPTWFYLPVTFYGRYFNHTSLKTRERRLKSTSPCLERVGLNT